MVYDFSIHSVIYLCDLFVAIIYLLPPSFCLPTGQSLVSEQKNEI